MEEHRGSFTVHDQAFNVLALKYDRGVYIWVGDESCVCNELHCGFPLKNIQGEQSVASTLIGNLDSISADISKSLAKRFGEAVFVSVNVQEADTSVLTIFQEKLYETVFKMFPKDTGS
ncbi:hypothetical protein X943_000209 [Babesia divergens]|uniref:Proteasome assembly chaperone 4 n=1 Tax=Babesia divergens TaxID=32595 RepID=A0AAD9GEY7_BABDI|nr:hypothetical protein X943_000209 [Babesia divergens]